MKKIEDLPIATHWLPAIFAGEYSALTEAEKAQVDEFMDEFADYVLILTDGEYFATDHISGQRAMCETVEIWR